MPEPAPALLPDQAERDRIRADVASTLFVEAGAGSGKTTALVDRVVWLVTSGTAELANVAAITFTEKAAAELRARLRRELGNRARAAAPEEGERCRRALEQLDGAAIGTLHAFAQRLLSEHPVEAGLPPRVEVLDEVASDVAFAQRWVPFFDDLLADADMERTLLLFFAAGARPDALRQVAQAFEDNWDLVDERVGDDAPEPPPVVPLFAEARAAARALLDEPCHKEGDGLRRRIEEIVTHLDGLADVTDEVALLVALGPDAEPKLPSFNLGRRGARDAWADADGMRVRVTEVGRMLEGVRAQVGRACARRIGAGPGSCSSTTCWSWPACCCATRTTDRLSGPRCTGATNDCSSTSSRTPIPSRSSWPCASPPPTPTPARRASSDGRTSPSHRDTSSWWATPNSPSTASGGRTSRPFWPRPPVSAPEADGSSSRPTSAPPRRWSTG